jgi:hypothetical protein
MTLSDLWIYNWHLYIYITVWHLWNGIHVRHVWWEESKSRVLYSAYSKFHFFHELKLSFFFKCTFCPSLPKKTLHLNKMKNIKVKIFAIWVTLVSFGWLYRRYHKIEEILQHNTRISQHSPFKQKICIKIWWRKTIILL